MDCIRFGPAGNSDSFYSSGRKATVQAPEWLAIYGLTAFEYQCGRGVRVTEKLAESLRTQGEKHGVRLSLHAPYYISLASADSSKRENSIRYIVESAQAVSSMGGDRIVVHPGGLGGLERRAAAELALQTLKQAQNALDAAGLTHIHICPETMGKINQLGDLEEVLMMCTADERLIPCVDFGHLNSRTHGGLNGREAFRNVMDTIENRLGKERAAGIHIHFSRIEYTDGGEKRHRTFQETEFGPEPGPLMELLAERGDHPVVICESSGTQAEDAVTMMKMYQEFRVRIAERKNGQ